MIHIKEAVVVEGIYDKRRLLEFLDGTVVETGGFAVFSDERKIQLLKNLARRDGIVILTDSDRAGLKIRQHLKGMLGEENVKHAYIPAVLGKERRKRQRSKDGLLGVEGLEQNLLFTALKNAGCTLDGRAEKPAGGGITRAQLYELGLYGRDDSGVRRAAVAKALCLPERVSVSALLEVANFLYTPSEFEILLKKQLPEGPADHSQEGM